jgi:hypothetical protein
MSRAETTCPDLPSGVAAVTDLAPTEPTSPVEKSAAEWGASVASRYTGCGPMFTPDEGPR